MAKQNYSTPVLSDELQEKIADAIQSYLHRGKWKEWGLDKIREQGSALLFHGPPGVGKTTTAQYVARKLHLRLHEVSIADFGSQVPGALARNIKSIFEGEISKAQIEQKQLPIIFLDECDAILVSRKKIGGDMMWMMEPITALLHHIGKYPGLVILATNLVPVLDEALERRLIAKIRFDPPAKEERKQIWKAKWPEKFPVQPTEEELIRLSEFQLTGAAIENVLLLWGGRILREDRQPIVNELIQFIELKYYAYFQN